MSERPVTIFLSAGEASGDEHASRLVEALRRRLPEARFVGLAGEKMAAAGCEVIEDITRKASMLGAPLLQLGYYLRMLRRVQKAIREIRPDVHVPVDSPAVNWHLASTAKKIGCPVVYYISPQVWAWAPWRVRKLARLTDHVACILPFEQRYLRDRGVNATYVGHPLLDALPPRPAAFPDLADAWYKGAWQVALLAGSRPGEITGHTRALLTVAQAIRRRWSKARCIFAARNEECGAAIAKACKGAALEIAVGRTRQILASSHFAVAVSGTVTLEAAYFGVPMVIFYRTGAFVRSLRWIFGKWAVPTPRFALVNILAGRNIVPELMPWRGNIDALRDMVLEVMDDLGYLFESRRNLLDVVEPLRVHAPQTASDNAAELIVKVLQNHRRK
jgi:lipid-A-disaccharide synthase